jgi:hypothetical protein
MAAAGSACYQRRQGTREQLDGFSHSPASSKDGSVPALFLSLLLAAEEPIWRPDTYPTVNPGLSTGTIENFREVFVDPAQAPGQLKPAEAHSGTSDLSIRNDLTAWTEVTIAGTKIGVLDALQSGVIRGVTAGVYEVALHYPNGFEKKLKVTTMSAAPSATAPVAAPPAGDAQPTP